MSFSDRGIFNESWKSKKFIAGEKLYMSILWLMLLLLFSSVNVIFVVVMKLIMKCELKNTHRDTCYGIFCLQLGVITFYLMCFEWSFLFTVGCIVLMWVGFFCFKGRVKGE